MLSFLQFIKAAVMASRHCLTARLRFILASTVVFCYLVEPGGFEKEDSPPVCPEEETHCGPLSCQDRTRLLHGFTLNRHPCRCDRLCVMYGDCCIDYFDHCVNDTHFPITSNYSAFFECITFFREYDSESYVVVARCPPSWPQDSVRQYCENDTLTLSDTLLTVPVDGPDITFKNVYCSVCHQVPAHHLESWNLSTWDCDYDEAGRPILDECTARLLEQPITRSSNVHRCYHNRVDTCPPTAPPSQAAFCENHTSVVHNYDYISFKNIYCADCNNNTGARLSCNLDRNTQLDTAFSISLLFDFTANAVSFREEILRTPAGPAHDFGTCNTWQIYDPFQNRCRGLRCPGNAILQSDACVDYPTNQVGSDSSFSYTNRTENCPQRLLLQDLILNHLEVNLIKLVDISIERTNSAQDADIYIHADFSVASGVQDVIEHFIYNETLFHATAAQCNVTTLSMISAHKAATSPYDGSSICDGFAIQHVGLINVTDGAFNMNGYNYNRFEFMHVTVYEFANEDVQRETSVRLCSPFASKRCPVLYFNRSDFIVSGSGRGRVFHHVASGMSIPDKDIWQLPDGSVRVCDFLSNVSWSAESPAWLTTLSDLSVASGACSLFFLVKTFITYSVFPALRNQPGQIVMNLMAALILAQAVLMTGGISVPWLCTLRATMLHFAWLSVFMWMSVMAWDIAYRMNLNRVISVRDEPMHGHKVLMLGLFAWGLPALFVTACYLMSKLSQDQPWTWLEYGGSYCWIREPLHSLLAFGVPVAVVILINCVLVVFMVYKVIVNRNRLAAAQIANNVKTELLLCSKIIVLAGGTWTLFLAANLLDIVAIWYISVVANSLQGALIGIIFLWRENVRSLWRQKLFGRSGHPDHSSSA